MELSPPAVNTALVAKELRLQPWQINAVIQLLDDGNTVPFITRYRKEQTGNLDEEQIRQIEQRVKSQRQICEKADQILRLIDAQGKLTPELRVAICEADSLKRLEDLYLPYRPRRRSRAEAAREKGLEPLADALWNRDSGVTSPTSAAAGYVNAEAGVTSTDDALQGASDIIAERISEDAEVRELSRKAAWRTGSLSVKAAKSADETSKEFRNYFDYSEPVWKIPPHRSLALNRGEKENALKVKFEWDRDATVRGIEEHYHLADHPCREFIATATRDSLDRLIHPSIEREVRRELSDQAEAHGIGVFARNLRSLLLQAPLQGQRVLAVDPGFRTGCKVAVLDECGQCLHTDVVYVTGSDEKKVAWRKRLAELYVEHRCSVIAIGNGTACRETEELVSELIREDNPDCRYLIVNEAGASIYSASSVAREEFPDFDATVRGTISIGRRLQDPLSELVKIDAQHIGVGMYQHDMPPKLMKESLDGVVESCVNFVGVDLNTASSSLLRYVSGLNQLIARRVVEWREQNGGFQTRLDLKQVPGIGDATFTQAAGFLKITGGKEPLDSTWIHPESYPAARGLLAKIGLTPSELLAPGRDRGALRQQLGGIDLEATASELNVGVPTLRDIIDALLRPGRDPRTDLPGPVFRQGVLRLEDLQTGMELTGTVLNVVDFGAFVDIGLKDSGLIHVSQMADHFVSDPHTVVAVGDIIKVWVQSVDLDRRRVGLTMLDPTAVSSEKRPQRQESRPAAKPQPSSPKPAKPVSANTKPRDPRAGTAPQASTMTGFDQLKAAWDSRSNG